MKKERPEIELYMYSSNQEFPVKKGHSTFLKRNSEMYRDVTGKLARVDEITNLNDNFRYDNDWVHDWSNFFPDWEKWTQIEGLGHREGDPLEKMIMRQEDFGGILFDRINDRIFRVNVPGYKLFQEILELHKKNKLVEFRSKEFESHDIEYFISFLKGAGLWSI